MSLSLRSLKKSQTSIPIYYFRRFYYSLLGKDIHCHQGVTILGVKNIQTGGSLSIGTSYVGFKHRSDRTFLNVRGKLIFRECYSIGRGCRFDIGPDAICSFGSGFSNADTNFIIMHGLIVGDHVVISWGCEFLDEDFHQLSYEGKLSRDPEIHIGNNVWIGCGVKILKGVRIGDGCVVAANSVVTKPFNENNLLIAGNPAVVLRRNISWG